MITFLRGAREGCHERNQPGTNTISGFQSNQGRVGSTFGNQGGTEDHVSWGLNILGEYLIYFVLMPLLTTFARKSWFLLFCEREKTKHLNVIGWMIAGQIFNQD